MILTPHPKQLYVMVGIPGSGKSFFRETYKFPLNTVIICTDDYIEDVAKLSKKTYSEIFQNTIADAETHAFELANECARNGYSVVWDQTNLTVKKRKRILELFPGYEKIAVVIQTTERKREERLSKRVGKVVPAHIIDHMKYCYVEPSFTEGFTTIIKKLT